MVGPHEPPSECDDEDFDMSRSDADGDGDCSDAERRTSSRASHRGRLGPSRVAAVVSRAALRRTGAESAAGTVHYELHMQELENRDITNMILELCFTGGLVSGKPPLLAQYPLYQRDTIPKGKILLYTTAKRN